ncbi:hypothetical protein NIES4071_30460 [Calothrix sp. NIES-4071]|nr:hypothetical protein NIES4071_30460 [Calothrix sp. NIES-4071]BAZ57366.1 hypothetical protein NIES4105_30400 [Calothrix sp. NIES-4105]
MLGFDRITFDPRRTGWTSLYSWNASTSFIDFEFGRKWQNCG